MRQAWRLHLSCWVALLCQAGAANFDAGALVQRELRLAGPRVKINAKTVVREIITHINQQLDAYVAAREADINKTQLLLQYTQKLGDPSLLTSPGLVPNLEDQGESGVVVMFLNFLRDPNFLKAAREGVKTLSKTASMLTLRTEKRLSELIMAITLHPDDRLKNIREFYEKEAHIVEGTLDAFFDAVVSVVKAAPGFEDVVGPLMTPLVTRMRNASSVRLNSMVLSDAGRTSFCSGPFFRIAEEYTPILAEVQEKIPLMEAFIQSKTPDVASEASDLLKQFGKVTATLANRLKASVRISTLKVCGEAENTPEPSVDDLLS